MTLIGREALVQSIVSNPAPLILLTGDSGIGKSSVLQELPNSNTSGPFRATPQRVHPYDGSLQSLMLQQLAEACSTVEHNQTILQRIGQTFSRAITRMANASTREIAKIAVDQIFGLIATRIGDEAASVLKAAVTSLTTTDQDTLIARINNTADQDVVKTIIALTKEARPIIGDLQIRIDDGDKLTDADFQLLTGLPDLLPSGIGVAVAYAVTDQTHVTRIRQARQRGAVEIRVPPLTLQDLEQWLADAGVDLVHLSEIDRISNGYPLVIDAATAHLLSGKRLSDLPVEDAFQAMTEGAWLSLETSTRAHARQLLPFSDPLQPDRIASLLEVRVTEWFSIEEELADSRIFSVTVDGQPWFHERRRVALWEHHLPSEQRSVIAEHVTKTLAEWLNEPGPFETSVTFAFADLLPLATSVRSNAPSVQAALDLSELELAQVFAALELVEFSDDTPGFVETSYIVDHARQVLHASGDAVAAIERLAEQGLLYTQANAERSITTHTIPDRATMAIILGRCTRAFGRVPLGRVASSIFQVAIRPRMGAFSLAQYGIGRPHLGSEYKSLRSPTGAARYPTALSMRGSYGARPLYLTATFDNETQRDAAHRQLSRIDEWIFGERLLVNDLYDLPCTRVPSLRFMRALEDLTGQNMTRFIQSGLTPKLDSDSDSVDIAAVRAKAIEYMRHRLTPLERAAFRLDQTMRTLLIKRAEGHDLIDIESARAGASLTTNSEVPVSWFDPLQMVKLTEELNLSHDERISHISSHLGSPDDPIIQAFQLFRKHAKAFNSVQPNVNLPTSLDELTELLITGVQRRHDDVLSLIESGLPVSSSQDYQPRTCHVLLHERADTLRINRPFTICAYTASSTPGLHLKFLDAVQNSFMDRQWISDEWGLAPDDILGVSSSTIDYLAAELLGYETQDVRAYFPI